MKDKHNSREIADLPRRLCEVFGIDYDELQDAQKRPPVTRPLPQGSGLSPALFNALHLGNRKN